VANAGVTLDDIDRYSYVIMLNLSTPADPISRALASSMEVDMGGPTVSSNANGLQRLNTVQRLLNQNRNIDEFYLFKDLLGSGAAGLVYRGISKETGRDYAVKVIDTRQLVISSSNADLITKEAELLRSLRHPNIIHLEDIFASGYNVYLVMELSTGGDLFDRIASKKRYSEPEAKEVMRQILDAMVYMHENKVAHRDLKPENILLARRDSDVDVKITDFGLAKKMDDKDGLKSYCGTPQYYAP
jgi:serine/threonine protein kinase